MALRVIQSHDLTTTAPSLVKGEEEVVVVDVPPEAFTLANPCGLRSDSPSSDSSLDVEENATDALLKRSWIKIAEQDSDLQGLDPSWIAQLLVSFQSVHPIASVSGKRAPETFIEDFARAVKIYHQQVLPKSIRFLDILEIVEAAREISKMPVWADEKVGALEASSRSTGLARSLLLLKDGTLIIELNKSKKGDRLLGEGSFSHVKLGYDLKRKKLVAISTAAGRAFSETKAGYEAAKALPKEVGVVSIESQFILPSKSPRKGIKYFVVMDFIDGQNLHEQIRKGVGDERLRAYQGFQLTTGLASIHKAGVCHCDIKTKNIMVDSKGNAFLVDFGLARSIDPQTGFTGRCGGTASYCSPQRLNGAPGHPKDDVFAMGGVLWNLWGKEIKSFMAWSSFDARWNQFELATQPEHLVQLAVFGMSDPNWMLKDGITLTGLKALAKTGDMAAKKAYLVARMLSTKPSDRPSASEVADYIEREILARMPSDDGAAPA